MFILQAGQENLVLRSATRGESVKQQLPNILLAQINSQRNELTAYN
jgi:hypothetical protein